MKTFIFISIAALTFLAELFFSLVVAAEVAVPTHALMTAQEQETQMRAKKRLYPGGKDEESLKVQGQLPTVTRKMGPTTDAPSEEPEVMDSSTD